MSRAIRTLAVGVGSLQHDEPALRAALALAARAGATLHAIHAFDLPDPLLEAYARQGYLEPGVVSRYAARLRRQLEALVELSAPGQPVVIHVRNGSAARALAQVAAEVDADLLLVGARAHGRIARFFLGSTADAVLRIASVPVLVVRDAERWAPERVLLTTDLSRFSEAVHARALELLLRLPGAESPEVRSLLVVAYDTPLPPPLRPDLLAERAEAELQEFLAAREPTPLAVQGRVRFGDTVAEVLAEAEDWQADLLVLGTQGRSGLARLMLGSVAGSVLRSSACNVLVIPAALLRAEEPAEAHEGLEGAAEGWSALQTGLE